MGARTTANRTTPVVDLLAAQLTDPARPMALVVDGVEWSGWVVSHDHMYVLHPVGNYSCRRDSQSAGRTYWTAFRRANGRTYRAYLGKDAALTAARLLEVGEDLAAMLAERPTLPAAATPPAAPFAVADVRTDATMLWLYLADGRVIGAPLTWFPGLAKATPAQRERWEHRADPAGISWPELDEDISARVLMGHPS